MPLIKGEFIELEKGRRFQSPTYQMGIVNYDEMRKANREYFQNKELHSTFLKEINGLFYECAYPGSAIIEKTEVEKIEDKMRRHGFPEVFLKWDENKLNKSASKLFKTLSRDGFYLHGGVGAGKTCLMVTFARKMTEEGLDCWYINAVEFMFALKATFNAERGELNDTALINEAASHPYLFIDDLGVEGSTQYTLQSFYLLLDKRYRENKKTFITSNFSVGELTEKLTDRITSRIYSLCPQVLDLGLRDLRLEGM